jgi:hypothetical protein
MVLDVEQVDFHAVLEPAVLLDQMVDRPSGRTGPVHGNE